MNGKRILVRLIWVFIGINLVLLGANYVVSSKEYKLSDERVANINAVLAMQGIDVQTDLPRDYEARETAHLNFNSMASRYVIEKNFFGKHLVSVKHALGTSKLDPLSSEKAQYCTFNEDVLIFDGNAVCYERQTSSESHKTMSLREAERLAIIFMKRISPQLQPEKYRLESNREGNDWQLTYYPVLEKLPVLDSLMTFKIDAAGVKEATMYLGSIEIQGNERQALYPVDQVLFKVVDELKAQGVETITAVDLVYRRLLEEENMWGQKIVPAYKIEAIGLEKPVFVNAYSNEIIK